jgi:3-(methylthio)propanoyl-CoA dehydrogenase
VLADGRRNGISVVRLEEKMGMHASPTCQMAFDDAEAEMLGAPGEGLARMFTMMNAERLDVAVEGVGLIEVALQRARHHAAERRQGRAPGSDAPIDPISRHRDVQRMLLTQMALAQGCRVMTLRTAVELELDPDSLLAQFMTPVCKAFCTDAAVEAANLAIQVHGGYGYCREYRVEQILRDARITPIYEGTNGIQAMTLSGRLLHLGGGAPADAFAVDINEQAERAELPFAQALTDALGHWRRATEAVRATNDLGMVATSYLRLTGLLAFACGWSRLESAAAESPNPARTRAVSAFVRDWMLPETVWLADRIANPPTPCADDVFADL